MSTDGPPRHAHPADALVPLSAAHELSLKPRAAIGQPARGARSSESAQAASGSGLASLEWLDHELERLRGQGLDEFEVGLQRLVVRASVRVVPRL